MKNFSKLQLIYSGLPPLDVEIHGRELTLPIPPMQLIAKHSFPILSGWKAWRKGKVYGDYVKGYINPEQLVRKAYSILDV